MDKVKTVLIDDDPQMLEELKLFLEAVGNFEVTAFLSPAKALEYLADPLSALHSIIISDVGMPEMDGYELGRAVREDYRLHHIPLLYLTAKTAVKDRIDARKITPHYFPKDGDRRELLSMIGSILEEHMVQTGVNPLTRLPGNILIERAINKMVAAWTEYAIFYIDFDNFKAYNDSYGTHAGDKAIQEGSLAIDRVFRSLFHDRYFVGHIGGDDFVAAVWGGSDLQQACEALFLEINKIRSVLYSPADIERGYFEAKNRQGEMEKFGLLSVSVGILSSETGGISGWAEASNKLASVKKKAKSIKGNSYCVDQRKDQQ